MSVGGSLDMSALARLHFNVLGREQQAEAIRRLATTGMSDHGISRATGLSVEIVRRVLAEREVA